MLILILPAQYWEIVRMKKEQLIVNQSIQVKLTKRDCLALMLAGLGGSAFLNANYVNAQDLGSIINAIGAARNSNNQSTNVLGLPVGVSNADADGGIRSALTNGAIASVLRLGRTDGYWADNLVKIALPNPLRTLQRNMQTLGISRPFDDLQLKINRAAEQAAPHAKDVFVSAINSFTLTDVVGVLRGGNTAGTDLLKSKTKPDLVTRFRPFILTAVNETGAGRSMDNISRNYGRQISRLGGLRNINSQNNIETGASTDVKGQLVDYAVSKALDGLFYYIGNEETQIRQNPAKRTNELLRKVFGAI